MLTAIMKKILYIIWTASLTSCYNNNVTEKDSKTSITISDIEKHQTNTFATNNDTVISHDNLNCGENTKELNSFNLDIDELSKYFYIASINSLDHIDTILTSTPRLTNVKFPAYKVRPTYSKDSLTLGDCVYIIGEYKSIHKLIRYLVFLDYSESEYRETIRMFSINEKGEILDIEDLAEISGDGGDSYNTTVRQINPLKIEFIFKEIHLADNEKMDTISISTKKGIIELKGDGQFIRKQ